MASMTAPRDRDIEIVMHDKDGFPTTNKDDAVSAEVTETLPDGSKQHTVMVDPAQRGRGLLSA
jgi:hypothetical protein